MLTGKIVQAFNQFNDSTHNTSQDKARDFVVFIRKKGLLNNDELSNEYLANAFRWRSLNTSDIRKTADWWFSQTDMTCVPVTARGLLRIPR